MTRYFSDYYGDQAPTITGSGSGPFVVASTVDSENGFSASLRSSFVCTVTNTGGDNWHLDDMQFVDGGATS